MLDKYQTLLLKIQSLLNCGDITFNKRRNISSYIVSNLNEIFNNILPHFSNYPLRGFKRKKIFRLFKLFKIKFSIIRK
jgi:hypothetical protein